MVRPGKNARIGTVIVIGHSQNRGRGKSDFGRSAGEKYRRAIVACDLAASEISRQLLEHLGEVPLPPYIERKTSGGQLPEDKERYQTVFARNDGSVAAPTAGLHFTEELLDKIRAGGCDGVFCNAARGAGNISAGEDARSFRTYDA